MSSAPLLSEEQVAGWHAQGFIVLPAFASAEEVASLRSAGDALLSTFEPALHPSVFSTTRQTETSDEHFLASADKVSFFLEEGVAAPDGTLTRAKELCVNKIGHALHELHPVFSAWTCSLRNGELLRALGLQKPAAMQSMLICKQPELGGVVVPHKDSCFLHTSPADTCLGLWLALEDATKENGCLWVVPGSHKEPVTDRFVLTDDRKTKWAGGQPPSFPGLGDSEEEARANGYIPLEAKAGTLVMLHGFALHASRANTSSMSRHAYSVHYVDSDAVWEPTNWLQKAAPPTPLP
jgi:phytanoyl-CoA hydroxylase